MKTFLITFILITGLDICNAQDQLSAKKLDLNGQLTLHIKSKALFENIIIKLATYHSFPNSDVSTAQDSLTLNKRDIYVSSPCRNLGRSHLSVGNSSYEILAAPGDTIELSVSSTLENGQIKQHVTFEGKNKEIQKYYQDKKNLINDPLQACMNQGMGAPNLASFKMMMDTTYQKLSGFWTAYQKSNVLPSWFIDYETNAINYSDAWLRIYMVWYQINYQKKKQIVPDSYYRFQSRIKTKNENAMYQYEYLRFLREQLFWQMRRSPDNEMSTSGLVNYARKELGEHLGNFVGIWELSSSVNNPNWIQTKFDRQFPAEFQYLVDYIRHRASENTAFLKPGDKAPNFALIDANDSLVTLNQYQGQVVYLSFWFTTCGACIKEMPFENNLAEQFRDKPFKIISICIGTPGAAESQQLARWRVASKRFGLKTIDLYSNKAWTKTLSAKYMVSSYPHYVLIGADGNVIENFADRPSQGIVPKIEKALTQINN